MIEIKTEALSATEALNVTDQFGVTKEIYLVAERPLTIFLNKKEIVTVMTMGACPHYLVAGFLLNQGLVEHYQDFQSIHIDWAVNSAAVYAKQAAEQQVATENRVVTSGCGQGTMFGKLMGLALDLSEDDTQITQSEIYALLAQLAHENEVYIKAGGVHTCGLCSRQSVLKTIEDVGRHNAIDSLTGFAAIEGLDEKPTVMYTTGRLTSEMVIKTAQMGIAILLSRSGATSMGVDIAKQYGMTLIARAKGQKFLVLNRPDRVIFDSQ